MENFKINKNYLLLKNWWETINLTNYEKSFFNRDIISFNQQLFRLKEKKIRIGIFGKSGVGKSSILNSLLKKTSLKQMSLMALREIFKAKSGLLKIKISKV